MNLSNFNLKNPLIEKDYPRDLVSQQRDNAFKAGVDYGFNCGVICGCCAALFIFSIFYCLVL